MQKQIDGTDLIIKNGRIQNEDYQYSFHQFYEDHGKILILYLILPGLKHDSLKIFIENKMLRLTGYFQREYMRIFRSHKISISGELEKNMKSNVFTSNYSQGILKLTLVVDSS